MNYLEHYHKLMTSRKSFDRVRGLVYYENHHIIPKWLGGIDDSSNMVLLTAREHFIAHQLLWKHYRDRPSALAFHKMTFSNNKNVKRKFSSKQFEAARIAFSISQTGDANPSRVYGSPMKGRVSPVKGRKLPPREHMRGDNNPSRRDDVRQKISESLTGITRTAEQIENMRQALLARPKLGCIHCSKLFDERNFRRWHGDNCKMKKETLA